MTRYVHDVVLFIDVSKKEDADGPRDDLKYIRSKSPAASVRRYVYRPRQRQGPEQTKEVRAAEDDWPDPDPSTPDAKNFFADLQWLARRQPSRLTILAHGLPGFIGKHPKNGYPGLDGRKMAKKLRKWGLRDVTRISVIACHGAVNEKLYFTDDELPISTTAEERKMHQARWAKEPFVHANQEPGINLFGPVCSMKFKEDVWSGLTEEAQRLKGSFAQQFHAALADPFLPFGSVKTEVTARTMRMVTSPEGNNLVESPFWEMTHGVRGMDKGPVTHHAPGTKVLFSWDRKRQVAQVVKYTPKVKEGTLGRALLDEDDDFGFATAPSASNNNNDDDDEGGFEF